MLMGILLWQHWKNVSCVKNITLAFLKMLLLIVFTKQVFNSGLVYMVFYDNPLVKFNRLLETYLVYAPSGFKSFIAAMPIGLKEKLFLTRALKLVLVNIN